MPDIKKTVGENLPIVTTNKKTEPRNDCGTPVRVPRKTCRRKIQRAIDVPRETHALTLRESKQAMTLPFSTWQLLGGWANLHSSSEREQVPLWNCLQTSNVSHFVSLTGATFKAMVLKRRGFSSLPSGDEINPGPSNSETTAVKNPTCASKGKVTDCSVKSDPGSGAGRIYRQAVTHQSICPTWRLRAAAEARSVSSLAVNVRVSRPICRHNCF